MLFFRNVSCMIFNFIHQYLRTIGTIILTFSSVAFYGLASREMDAPKSVQFDILQPKQEYIDLMPELADIWGLSRQLTIFTEEELERWRSMAENVQYHNDMRRNKRQKMTRYLVNNYDVKEREARVLVRSADANAHKYKIDLELLMAIIFVESTYKVTAQSKQGAIGLMQVVPKWHLDKIERYGDVSVLYDIRANIAIGTEILMEYLEREGNIRQALHRYNGSKDDKTLKYSNRVLNKYSELKARNYMEDVRLNSHFDIIGQQFSEL